MLGSVKIPRFPDVTLITRDAVELWWDELTPDQQKARGSNFRKCFNFLMKKKLCTSLDYNPFTKNDAFVVLERKPPLDKARMHIGVFGIANSNEDWLVHYAAGWRSCYA